MLLLQKPLIVTAVGIGVGTVFVLELRFRHKYHRMNDYKLETTKVITYDGREFSGEWKLTMEGKHYTLIPKIDGMFNIYFFEQLAGIYDEDGKEVGYCFVELLDGVRNRNKSWEAFITKK